MVKIGIVTAVAWVWSLAPEPACAMGTDKKNPKAMSVFLVVVFLPFLGLLPRHMEVPRLEVESEL